MRARTISTRRYRARVYSHKTPGFRDARGSNVLIYWPHGFGDWVQLGYVLPLLEPSNRYWITRFGDDNVSLLEGHPHVRPAYTGFNATHCHDGGAFGIRHFGIEQSQVDGGELELQLPLATFELCRQESIDVIFWSSFPEPAGLSGFPFHSKARNLLRYLLREGDPRAGALDRPLPSALSFEPPAWAQRWVEARMNNLAEMAGHRLCIVGRNGYTSVGKNWGHLWREELPPDKAREGEECRDFMRALRRKDRRWMFLVMEDRLFEGDDTVRSPELRAFSYAELFGTPDDSALPFGLVMRALLHLAELVVGVPAGPYHLSMAKADVPTVGIWTEHLPCWFDEPNSCSVHLVGRNVRDRGLERRPGSFASMGGLRFDLRWLDTRIIPAAEVVSAVEHLL